MSEIAKACPGCGVPLQTKPEDGTCRACGVDPFLVEVVGQKRALADAMASQAEDFEAFVGSLARMLEEGFAEVTEVKTVGIFSKHVSEVKVTLNHHVYRLEVHGKKATGHRSRAVKGITLKEETLALKDWLAALSADLEVVAAENQQAREALGKFVR